MANERLRRSKPTVKMSSAHAAQDYSFNDYAGGLKVVKIGGVLISKGAGSTAIPVGAGSQVAIYNNSASTDWAKTGDSSVGSPVAGDIALAPMSYTLICVGDNAYIRTAAATSFVYILLDDTVYTP